jgi:hypothetical protein
MLVDQRPSWLPSTVVFDMVVRLVMSERIIELLHGNLQEVFSEGDAACRRAVIDQFYD